MNLKLRSQTIIDGHFSPDQILSFFLNLRQIEPTPSLPAFKVKTLKINPSQNILIYGDYDVDGITSTAILWQSLYSQGYKVTPFIPDRQKDGYGFKAESFFRFQKEKGIKFDVLITIDNGIVAHSEFKKIPKIKIIVIDHHLPDKHKLSVDQLIHSPDLSAAGLAYFVAQKFDPKPDLGLAALGTVADCLPLTGPNRSIVYHGLRQLRLNPNPGIKKLIQISRARQDSLSAYDLGFLLGPRINAVGRLSNPTDALRLLCSPNSIVAGKYAAVLNDLNLDRQTLQKESLDLAEKQADPKQKLLFIAHKSFHPGIIGLIAGRLTEKYYLPSIVISLNGEVAKGSCRSIKELNIISTLRQSSDLLIDVGGHPAAAGFSILDKNIPKFQKKITQIINRKLKNKILKPTLEVDAQMKLSAVTPKNIKALEKLEPFGIANPEPLFLFKSLKIISKRLLGQTNDHLKLKLDDPGTKFPENIPTEAIAFKKGKLDKELGVGDLIDVVARLDLNTWNGITTPQLVVKEIIKN